MSRSVRKVTLHQCGNRVMVRRAVNGISQGQQVSGCDGEMSGTVTLWSTKYSYVLCQCSVMAMLLCPGL